MKKALSLFFLPLAAAAQTGQAPKPVFRTGETDAALRQVQSATQRQEFQGSLQQSSAGSNQNAPELYEGESADVGPQVLLAEKQRRNWFEAGADVQYYYTSNLFLTEKDKIDTGVLLSTAQFAIAPEAMALGGGEYSVRAGYRHQMYNYGLDKTSNQLNNFNFDVGTVFLNHRYKLPSEVSLYFGTEYNRYLSHEAGWREFYSELALTWGAEKSISFGENHQLSLSYIGINHVTHTDPNPTTNVNDRIDSILSVNWSWQFYPRFILQPYYRVQQVHYWRSQDRDDFINTMGLSLGWYPSDSLALRLFTSYEFRESDDENVDDYHKLDAGGGLSLNLRF
jgi:hypothetical protein